uniref:Putative ovule protein n=1 Tax=Solanum chacoense TaxID=4108 RepID=A0A0V0HZK9_SOLCH
MISSSRLLLLIFRKDAHKNLHRTGSYQLTVNPTTNDTSSGLIRDTLIPPDRFLIPPVSECTNDPAKVSKSYRPYKINALHLISLSHHYKKIY